MTELRSEFTASPDSQLISVTSATKPFASVNAGVVRSVLMTPSTMSFSGLGTAGMSSARDGVSDVLLMGSVRQVSPVIVGEVIVEMSNLHARRARSDEGKGYQLVDELLAFAKLHSASTVTEIGAEHPSSLVSPIGNYRAAVFIDEDPTVARNLLHEGILS
ncbi:hypothetical protein SEA_BONRAY_122 [Mycobacterium phage Bonray]|nr:hypothetical protein SEA_BONRAY_122 [Mycobacterium phage Bonray]